MDENKENSSKQNQINEKISFIIAVLTFFIFTIAMFFNVLFTKENIVLSCVNTDLYNMFLPFAKFGFGEIKKGNLPLWCPHNFCGYPFLGNFQSALLYPFNFFYLILPVAKGVNYTIALHIFLSGLFTYLWISRRNFHPLASITASLLFMFSGVLFLRIYAGHMPLICSSVWIPLILFSLDSFFDTEKIIWTFPGIFSVAMQILSGYPQGVFFTFITVIIYSFFIIMRSEKKTSKCLFIILIYVGGALLSAVQLFPGLDASQETVRSGGVAYEFATSYSFIPENLITLLAPGFFGDITNFYYWGKWFLWEECIFIGVTGFILALYGALYGKKEKKRYSLYVILILFIIALGNLTPLYWLLYKFVPFFDKFRSPGKIMLQTELFIIMLSAAGLDTLIEKVKVLRIFSLFLFIFGFLVMTVSLLFKYSPQIWPVFLSWFFDIKGEEFLKFCRNKTFIEESASFAFKGLLISAVILLFLSLLFYLINYSKKAVYLIAILGVTEVFLFAGNSIETFNISDTDIPSLEEFYNSSPGDYRIANYGTANLAMYTGLNHIWGYDPSPIKRYGEFMAFIHGKNPDDVTSFHPSSHNLISPLHRLLRCKFNITSFFIKKTIRFSEIKKPPPMERIYLIKNYRVLKNRDEIFEALRDESFNPEEEIILEEVPRPEPKDGRGEAKIINSSTDWLIIEAELEKPAILFITDTYSKDWKAFPLAGSSQKNYKIIPADYIFRAIPLSAGKHKILLKYSPFSFVLGKWVSLISFVIYIILLLYFIKTKK